VLPQVHAQVTAAQTSPPQGWSLIPVPQAWTSPPLPQNPAAQRYGWYRTWLKPHDSFFTKHDRDLFAESVTLSIRSLANAHEVFINGVRIGSGGSFPPNYKDGLPGNHRHKVTPGLLKKGLWNEVAIRVYNHSGPGGFLSEAPFIMDYFNECVLEGPWEFQPSDTPPQLGQILANRPTSSAFDQYHDANRVLGEAASFVHGKKLSPTDSLKLMRPGPDFAVDLLLSEPLVAQPTHISFDERGRLWVAQYRQYPYPAGLKMLSRDKYYRAQYDKVPSPPPNHTRGRDIVSIHEDTNADGIFDKHSVFQDGLNLANAAVRGRGGVWIMNTPYLLFYPDANFDDIPDGPPVVHLAGFGMEDTHSVANGLVWGLDGWLYGGQGSTTSSHVVRPGLDPPNSPGVYFEGCMVWRYHPESHAYEVFAEGSGNTFGLEIDGEGRLFSGHNGGETRGWHYLQGGYYLKQGFDPGKFGPQRNPYTYGDLGVIHPTKPIQRFSHLFAVGEGTALPQSFQGKLFAIDPLHNLVIAAERSWRGATFDTTDLGNALFCEDDGFRPVFIANAPDGSLFIADFYEHYIAHGQHYQSQIDPTTGRIYRLQAKNATLNHDLNLLSKSSVELAALLDHPNKWHRHTAVRVLGDRKDAAIRPALKQNLITGSPRSALGSLWALHQMNELDEGSLLVALQHPEAPVRSWAVRLLGDRWGRNPGLGSSATPPPSLPPSLQQALVLQCSREPHPEVRSQIAASARRLPTALALQLVSLLAARSEDIADAFIPSLCWWIFEHHLNLDRPQVLAFFSTPQNWSLPIVSNHILPRIMRRLATEGRRQDLLACAQLLRSAPQPQHATQLLKGFQEALRGRPATALPEELESAIANAGGAPLVVRLRQRQPDALPEVLSSIKNQKLPPEDRLLLTRALGEIRPPEAVEPLLELASADPIDAVRRAAIAALSAFDAPSVPEAVLQRFASWNTDVRGAALSLLLARPKSTLQLLQAIEIGRISPSSIPAEIADRLRSHPDSTVRDRATKKLPKPEANPDFTARLTRVNNALRSGTANPYNGEPIFQQRCAACHKLFFKGGNVGPDLTHYQRDNLSTVLVSVLNPNAEIREGYAAFEIETHDGRSLTGFISDRDANVVVLRGLDSQDTVLRQSEIKSLEPTGRSLMPDGLLDDLNDQQVRDFFAFLRSSQPFTR